MSPPDRPKGEYRSAQREGTPLTTHASAPHSLQRGFGLIEIMVGILISMLMVLIIYQVYDVSEGQKRTITSASDAQQNAAYGLFLIGQDLMGAGQVISASTVAMSGCAMLRPVPAIIGAGATDNDPDSVTVLYGGSSSLSTPAPLLSDTSVGTTPPGTYVVAGPLGFSPNDVIVAVQGTSCTLSIIGATGISVAPSTGITTITHALTPTPGNNTSATYGAVAATLVNLGQAASPGEAARFGQTLYAVDPATNTLRTQSLLPMVQPVTPVVSDVVNLKAQFGLDTDNDGTVDVWQPATGVWSAANLPLQPPATWQQIRAVRVAIVTRSPQYEVDAVTPGPIEMFCSTLPCAAAMTLASDDQHYRYKVLETTIPFRNALWNAP
jgi:type IV pilus assembly protein PilW